MQNSIVDLPPSRRLRVYAFDPSLAQRLQTAPIQEIVIPVRWELDRRIGKLPPGPVGEYIEVVDIDPASSVVYPPVDLDDPSLLAQDGLPLSEGNPQFHQQMVYAVAMATIEHFERALGRVALWAPRQVGPTKGAKGQWEHQFVRRLRLYPHALRDRNAYYSPDKKAILFGYFPVRSKDAFNTPGTTVFACLSHDIIAHEVTHALLDGVHPRFNEPSNPHVHAFHEAFADIVALFQHFSYPSILCDQIARTRGRLDTSENLLAQLAQQFGRATGRGNALRDALGEDVDGTWRRRPADPTALETATEAHSRGAVLVAAVFGAFLLVYRRRTEDLYRIATQGSGVLPEGDIHPDLAERLAQEASDCALYLLRMCIRALDYCPPVNITFGDYLRAVITAETNLNPEDEFGYSTALIESCRQWGIYPAGIRSMSKEALIWPSGTEVIAEAQAAQSTRTRRTPSKADLRTAREQGERAIKAFFEQHQTFEKRSTVQSMKWDLESDRFHVWQNMQQNRRALWGWLVHGEGRRFAKACFGIVLEKTAPKTVYRNKAGEPTAEIHSVRTALRRDARGSIVTDLVVEITQRRRGYFSEDEQRKTDARATNLRPDEKGDFKYRAGCTIVIDTTRNSFRHIIRTPGPIDSENELAKVRRFLTGEADAGTNAFDSVRTVSQRDQSYRTLKEPFAMLHRHVDT